MNGIDVGLGSSGDFGFRARNYQDVFIIRTMFLHESDLLVDVTFYAATERRVKLGQIANFHPVKDTATLSRSKSPHLNPLPKGEESYFVCADAGLRRCRRFALG